MLFNTRNFEVKGKRGNCIIYCYYETVRDKGVRFTHLGHECRDLLSPCDGMHLCTDYTSV